MWNLSVSGPGAGSVRYDVSGAGQNLWGANPTEEKKDDVEADKKTVAQMLKQLDDAEKGNKNQTAQDLRDKLNEKRKALGEEKFKEILEQLKKDASTDLLALLKRLFPDLFADEPSPAPAPGPSPGGGGGGGRVNPKNFGGSEPMSNLPITDGSKHFNYKPDASNPGKKPDNIWSGFSQGPDGNCVTVSAIKGAMMKFGQKPTDVFKDVKETGGGYYVKMRDGFELTLSKGELRHAAAYAQFKGDNPGMITDANFMYAASAKRAQMEGNGYDDNPNAAKQSFAHAMQSLNNGEMGWEALDRLGLKDLYRRSSSSELASGKLGVVDYGHHSMAVIGGRIELWGGRGEGPQEGNAYAFV
ncbi:hypothetical protein HU759_023260 [Pseudomonas sp. OE 28.3]|nr:hypothetical protein HU759_023260 [Pseudomonas sp. OE 28.3]